MNRPPIKSVPALYTELMPSMIEIARQCGYALGIHGSMTHDLDLIAAPWVFNALPGDELVRRIRDHVGGFIDDRDDSTVLSPSPETKVHHRKGWCIYFDPAFIGPYIDISVMPRIDFQSKTVID